MDKAMELSMPLFTIEETIIKPKTNQYEAEKKGPTDSLIDNGTWNGLLPLYQQCHKDSINALKRITKSLDESPSVTITRREA